MRLGNFALSLVAVLCIVSSGQSRAVSITQRAGDNFRTAANNHEFLLDKQNVTAKKFGLLRTYDFDAKVETQPLVVENGAGSDDLVIVTTMQNEVIGINGRTNATVYKVKLGPAADTSGRDDMDMWGHTPTWGISATPIIDPASNTLFVAAWVLKTPGDNRFRDYYVHVLNPLNGTPKAAPVRIFGQSQEGNGCWFNDANATFTDGSGQQKQYAYPKLRAGLALTGNDGLVLAFAANGESFKGGRANPHGFVVAYDTRGLLQQAGVSRDPAIFCATAFNSWGGGIWHAGGAPVTDGDMIYVASSNGTSNNGDTDLSESMVKLQFVPGSGGSRPSLNRIDFYKAFMDERTSGAGCLWSGNDTEVSCGRAPVGSAGADWDFGAAGPLMIPGSSVLLQGTKDGILYGLDKNDLGRHDKFDRLLFKPPLVASYHGGGEAENWDRANRLNRSLPCPSNSDHGWFQPCGDPENNRMHHIHSLALVLRDNSGGIVHVWGENANLKSYNVSTSAGVRPTFRAEGSEIASGNEDSPGGMPGGLLMVSGKPSAISGLPGAVDFGSAILWVVYAKYGDANKHFAEGQLVAYDATTILPGGKLKRLFRTGDGSRGGLGKMSRMIPPVVANGRVYVMIYRVAADNETVVGSQLKVYGLKRASS
ncbi:hypothetical protein [Methylococcus sp. EFPC2]|uniref:hypothetical protein n=1 Tax=Methylococcus sp. EFPC2 TaxID=2812648 RepID=UPI001967C134|nr:hypothetical protein [Methylococcus sp. EFPC2]QSA95972.1 hypothetical protein JWZ97_12065 [Methylococcus sp. EFPC2]